MNEIIKGTKNRAEFDYYATSPKCVEDIVRLENIKGYNVLEPCAGELHISDVLSQYGNEVWNNDLVQRSRELNSVSDFLNDFTSKNKYDLVVTNPPFKNFVEFLEKSFKFTDKVILFGRIQILEGKKRKSINEKYLKKVYIYSYRVSTAKNGDEKAFSKSSNMCFCWFVYDKNKSLEQPTIIEWI